MAMSYYNNLLDHLADGCCIASCCPVVLSSRCPLTAPPFHRLITQANCCIASLCAAILSSRRATLSSSHRPFTSHCTAFLSLIAQAGCCLASRHAAVSSSCHTALLPSCHPLTTPPSRCLIPPSGCCVRPLVVLSLYHPLVILRRLVALLPLVAPPSRPLITLPSCPLFERRLVVV